MAGRSGFVSDDRPVRPVRNTKQTRVEWAKGPVETPVPDVSNFEPILRGVMEIDVSEAYRTLTEDLKIGVSRMSGSALIEALDSVHDRILLAARLKNRARREYEIHKSIHEEWLEEKRATAVKILSEQKEAGAIRKQISEAMVTDFVRAHWPDDYRRRIEDLTNMQAATHTLEDLYDTWRSRARALSDLKDLITTYRPPERR